MLLDLSDGNLWEIEAADRCAQRQLFLFSEAMGRGTPRQAVAGRSGARRISVRGDGDHFQVETLPAGERYDFPQERFADERLRHSDAAQHGVLPLVALSLVVAAQILSRGGVLLHGALAEKGGRGVLMLGPSGRGKTTASGRLPASWRSLSDDVALILPRAAGAWRAHPWPTWSACGSGCGGARDVQEHVDLGGLFFMSWAAADRAEPVGPGRAACLLMESFEQAWWAGDALFPPQRMKSIREQAFANSSALAASVPAFVLHISPDGAFWEQIEEALGGAHSAA